MSRLIAFIALSFLASTAMAQPSVLTLVNSINYRFRELFNAGKFEDLAKEVSYLNNKDNFQLFPSYGSIERDDGTSAFGHDQIAHDLKYRFDKDQKITDFKIKSIEGNGEPYRFVGVTTTMSSPSGMTTSFYGKQVISGAKIEILYLI